MASKQSVANKSDATADGGSRDIWFECPACDKSLVVDEAGAGLIIECPQCHISVIVPPAHGTMLTPLPPMAPLPPAPAAPAKPVAPKAEPTLPPPSAPSAPAKPVAAKAEPPLPPSSVTTLEVAALHERLEKLAGQLRELQTQWTEVTNRVASRINEVNRELVVMARLDTSQKQILKEWNQIVSEIAASAQDHTVVAATAPAPNVPRGAATRIGAK